MNPKTKNILLKTGVNLCRLLLAATLVFSGFVKANDPYGTAYKIADYLAAWNIDIPGMIVLTGAVVLAFIEFIIGLYLLFGISRRPIARITVVLMGIMTVFTVYIAIFNPVADCGCFGDAIILTNTETLLKNIVLLAASVVVLRNYSMQTKFLSKNTEWLISIFSNVYVLLFAGYCVVSLPVIDFRPYHVGADIRKGIELPDNLRPQYDIKIVYERNGEKLELGIEDDDPDSTWTYVETKRTQTKPAGQPLIADFYITEESSGEDLTEEIVNDEGYNFLLIAPLLEKCNQGYIGDINNIYDYATENGYGFYCITASDTVAQKHWTEHTGGEYSYYRGDERTLKTIVRSSPGLVLLKDGKIIRKRSTFQLPGKDELNGKLEDIDFGKADILSIKRKITNILLLFVLPLLILTLLDRIAASWSFYRKIKRKSKELQLENIERKLGIEKSESEINT